MDSYIMYKCLDQEYVDGHNFDNGSCQRTKMDREPVVEGSPLPAQPPLLSIYSTGLTNALFHQKLVANLVFAIPGNQGSITHTLAKSAPLIG